MVPVVTWPNEKMRTIVGTGWELILFWALLGKTPMQWFREAIRTVALGIRWDWRLKFIPLATVLQVETYFTLLRHAPIAPKVLMNLFLTDACVGCGFPPDSVQRDDFATRTSVLTELAM